MKNFTIALASAALLAVATAPIVSVTSVSAATTSNTVTAQTIEIPITTVVFGAKGSEHQLTTRAVSNGTYKLTVKAVNQDSVHPNTDIVVRSGQASLTVTDVEQKAFTSKTADGTLTVANGKVDVSVKLGADKVFSGGVTVVLTAVPPVTPPTPPPVTPPTPPVQPPVVPTAKPQILPVTGPADAFGIAAITTIGSFIGHRYLRRQK